MSTRLRTSVNAILENIEIIEEELGLNIRSRHHDRLHNVQEALLWFTYNMGLPLVNKYPVEPKLPIKPPKPNAPSNPK